MKRFLPLLLVLLIIAGIFAWWQKRARQNGRLSAPESAAMNILRPGQKLLLGFGGWIADVGRVIVRRGDIVSENTRLRAKLSDAQNQNNRLHRYRRENEELRALLKMKKPSGGSALAAEIVSFNINDNVQHVFLNAGARQGVRPKDIVYTAQGIVGHVVALDSKLYPFPTSEVLLLTDRGAGAGAMIARTGALGVVQGTGGDLCKLDYMGFAADVREGDLVLTSGLVVQSGGVYPRGLVIGRVIKVQRDKTMSRLTAFVDPAVSFDQLGAVLVRVGANR